MRAKRSYSVIFTSNISFSFVSPASSAASDCSIRFRVRVQKATGNTVDRPRAGTQRGNTRPTDRKDRWRATKLFSVNRVLRDSSFIIFLRRKTGVILSNEWTQISIGRADQSLLRRYSTRITNDIDLPTRHGRTRESKGNELNSGRWCRGYEQRRVWSALRVIRDALAGRLIGTTRLRYGAARRRRAGDGNAISRR